MNKITDNPRFKPGTSQATRRRALSVWPSWLALVDQISDESYELLAEDFGVLRGTFRDLQLAGVDFDPAFIAWFDFLQAQAIACGLCDDVEPDDPTEESEPFEELAARLTSPLWAQEVH